MMTVAEWRKRAQDCITASRLASDKDAQLQWLALSDVWLKCSEWREREKFSDQATRGMRPVIPAFEPDSAEPDSAEPDRTEADRIEPDRIEPDRAEPDRTMEYAERLRVRLALVDFNEAAVPADAVR